MSADKLPLDELEPWDIRMEALDDGHIVTNADVRRFMQEEIDALRTHAKVQAAEVERLKMDNTDVIAALNRDGEIQDRIREIVKPHDDSDTWVTWPLDSIIADIVTALDDAQADAKVQRERAFEEAAEACKKVEISHTSNLDFVQHYTRKCADAIRALAKGEPK